MVSPNSLISYETARSKIGMLPSLHPRRIVTKIHTLYTHLSEVLAKIPSFQSPNHGYQGMVDTADVYALTGEVAWINFSNPGFHRQADGSLDPIAQRDANTISGAATMVYTTQHNVKGAVSGYQRHIVATPTSSESGNSDKIMICGRSLPRSRHATGRR